MLVEGLSFARSRACLTYARLMVLWSVCSVSEVRYGFVVNRLGVTLEKLLRFPAPPGGAFQYDFEEWIFEKKVGALFSFGGA